MFRNSLAILAAAAIGLGLAQSASAADLPVRPVYKAPTMAPAPVSSWTGCYVGGHAGYSWSHWDDNSLPYATSLGSGPAPFGDPIVFGYDGKYKTDGFAGGFQVGCDKQYGAFLLGVVGDFSWTSQSRDSAAFQIAPSLPALGAAETANVDLKYYGTARGRLGYIAGPAMIYVTGGLAWARASMDVRGEVNSGATAYSFAVSDTANFVGWTVGVGGEWMFAPNWTLGVEYLHLDFGDANFRFGTAFPNGTSTDALATGTNVSLTTDVVRATVNYRF